jgi:hypothetical protein
VRTLVRPIRLASPGEAADWPQDIYNLESASLEGSAVRLAVSYTGGCKEHRFELLALDWFVRSGELHVDLLLTHDARNDACKAIVRESLDFSLLPLFVACRDDAAKTRGGLVLRIDGRSLSSRILVNDEPCRGRLWGDSGCAPS